MPARPSAAGCESWMAGRSRQARTGFADRATTASAGLKACCDEDKNFYGKGIEVTMENVDVLGIRRDGFRGKRNYALLPRSAAGTESIVSWLSKSRLKS